MADDFSRVGYDAWIMKLIPDENGPTPLSDADYLKLKAWLVKPPPNYVAMPGDEVARVRNQQQRLALERLRALCNFNEFQRASGNRVGNTPTTEEEAKTLGYVYSQVILETLTDEFTDSPALSRFLDSNDGKKLRQYKPHETRRIVNAADLLNFLFERKRAGEKAADEFDETIQAKKKLHRRK